MKITHLSCLILLIPCLLSGCTINTPPSTEKTEKTEKPTQASRSALTATLLNNTDKPLYWGTTKEKRIALTYDMEHYTEETNELLDLLRLWGIQVTFFVQGQFVREAPRELRIIAEDGHEIGNHSWTHPNLTKLALDEVRNEVLRNEEAIQEQVGIDTKPLFRCPYGACEERERSLLASLGYREIYWSNDTNDWQDGTTPQEVITGVLDNLEPGMIVLFHNTGEYSVESTETLLYEVQQRGYTITTISGILE